MENTIVLTRPELVALLIVATIYGMCIGGILIIFIKDYYIEKRLRNIYTKPTLNEILKFTKRIKNCNVQSFDVETKNDKN